MLGTKVTTSDNFRAGFRSNPEMTGRTAIEVRYIYTLFHYITKFIQHRARGLLLSPQKFEEFCKRIVLMVSCYTPLSNFMVPTEILWLGKLQAVKGFIVGIELGQENVLFPLFLIVYMNWIDKRSQADKCATNGNCKISCLPFTDDLILLPQNLAFSAN